MCCPQLPVTFLTARCEEAATGHALQFHMAFSGMLVTMNVFFEYHCVTNTGNQWRIAKKIQMKLIFLFYTFSAMKEKNKFAQYV